MRERGTYNAYSAVGTESQVTVIDVFSTSVSLVTHGTDTQSPIDNILQ